MNKRIQIHALIAVMAAGLMFSSCGNIDIVKRKYRPGFHVDVSKKRQKTKVVEESATADSRKSKKEQAMDPKQVKSVPVKPDNSLTADVEYVRPLSRKQAKAKVKDVVRTKEFEDLTFKGQMRTIKNTLIGAPSPASDTHWMAWVSFGTGVGSSGFALIALIVAFFGISLWPLALTLGIVAIVFAIIHAKKGYSGERFRKLGLLFGIIGAGVALLAMIFWILWWVNVF